jgi:hypothetical protein
MSTCLYDVKIRRLSLKYKGEPLYGMNEIEGIAAEQVSSHVLLSFCMNASRKTISSVIQINELPKSPSAAPFISPP